MSGRYDPPPGAGGGQSGQLDRVGWRNCPIGRHQPAHADTVGCAGHLALLDDPLEHLAR
jgi:hypothetical protein